MIPERHRQGTSDLLVEVRVSYCESEDRLAIAIRPDGAQTPIVLWLTRRCALLFWDRVINLHYDQLWRYSATYMGYATAEALFSAIPPGDSIIDDIRIDQAEVDTVIEFSIEQRYYLRLMLAKADWHNLLLMINRSAALAEWNLPLTWPELKALWNTDLNRSIHLN